MYAGLEISWPDASGSDSDPRADIVLAEADAFGPTAAEYLPTGVRLFFRSASDRQQAAAHLREALPDTTAMPIDVPDERWAERSQAALRSVKVGRLTVAPPWDAPADCTSTIVIQPSMGFGTGHHASTRLCLRLLQETPIAGATVLDAGTGSGVLAIAARKLGAASVIAVDVDPDAIESARECAALNALANEIDLRQADLEREARLEGEPFDVILANLTGGMLVRMAGRLSAAAVRGGVLIASGVTRDEEASVIDAFTRTGSVLVTRLVEDQGDEWVGLQFAIRP